jgi:chromosome segregation ATPase
MSIENAIALIMAFIALVGVIVGFFKIRPDNRLINSNAAETLERLSTKLAARIIELNALLEKADTKIADLQKKLDEANDIKGDLALRVDALEKTSKDQATEISDLTEWIGRLCAQVKELGGTPVQILRRMMTK